MTAEKVKNDPAFLFYPADASEDTQFLNRLERGCYFDLLKAQKKFRRFSMELIRKVLGRDFETCWPALEAVLKKDGENYFIEWADTSIIRRAEYSEKQRARIKEYWDRKHAEEGPSTNQPDAVDNTTVQPTINRGNSFENGNETVNVIDNKKEYDNWTEQILDGNDQYFEQMFMKEGIPPSDEIQDLVIDHRDLLSRYPNMRPPDQHAFRRSCIKHIKENLSKKKNAKSSKIGKASTVDLAAAFQERVRADAAAGKFQGSQ